ncbi:MAG: hypothetical protein IPP82_15370 [Xanthomonadales bacterium]|nr:hypothetical protein [Xanthomonadales bacterium]
MRKTNLIAILMLCTSEVALAGQAEICYSPPVPYSSAVPPGNSTAFVCPISGTRTLPELAALGWQVVQLTPVTSSANGGAGSTHITNQLVIQKN